MLMFRGFPQIWGLDKILSEPLSAGPRETGAFGAGVVSNNKNTRFQPAIPGLDIAAG
jgi:hypothetical protein